MLTCTLHSIQSGDSDSLVAAAAVVVTRRTICVSSFYVSIHIFIIVRCVYTYMYIYILTTVTELWSWSWNIYLIISLCFVGIFSSVWIALTHTHTHRLICVSTSIKPYVHKTMGNIFSCCSLLLFSARFNFLFIHFTVVLSVSSVIYFFYFCLFVFVFTLAFCIDNIIKNDGFQQNWKHK